MPQILRKGSKNLGIENWKVYHPNGKHMFTCSERKAEWYLKRNLAEIIGEKEIQLTFIPKGYGFSADETFGLSGRNIICVVTGSKDDLQRHHIVPYCYRKHFKEEYKSKNHHDVVLVTYSVHQYYETLATKFKDELAIKYGVRNLNEANSMFTKEMSEFAKEKVKSLSGLHSIFKAYGKLPQDKINQILKLVANTSGMDLEYIKKLNYIQLYKLYQILKDRYNEEFKNFKAKKSLEYDHGYQIVKQLDTHEKIEDFIKMWRKHFIETMNPLYMPEGWSIDFRCRVEL